jgi:uridylate kinase
VVIFGAGSGLPYFSTDTVAVQRALETHCDEVIMGKNGVDGVYNKDPNKFKNAKKYVQLSYTEALIDDLKVMDASALSIARDNNVLLRVFGLEGKGNIVDALMGKEIGTLVNNSNVNKQEQDVK